MSRTTSTRLSSWNNESLIMVPTAYYANGKSFSYANTSCIVPIDNWQTALSQSSEGGQSHVSINKVMKPLGITSCQFLWDKLKIIACMNRDIILTIKCNREMDTIRNELKERWMREIIIHFFKKFSPNYYFYI